MRVDIFCRVVDNFGDIGVCWRLARQLAHEHDCRVRLWVDDLDSFRRLEPDIQAHLPRQCLGTIEVVAWDVPAATLIPGAYQSADHANSPRRDLGPAGNQTALPDVVIEGFGCNPPEAYIVALRHVGHQPTWINLEYLSAEAWVDDCHLKVSALPDGGRKFFFFPGFRPSTGGLLRERDLICARDTVQSSLQKQAAGLTSIGLPALAMAKLGGDPVVLLFCYPQAPTSVMLHALHHAWCTPRTPLSARAVHIAVPEGVAVHLEGQAASFPGIHIHRIPFMRQPDFDTLLWCTDLNIVRGEDSFVRAIWAGRPMIWNIYPQADAVHLDKLFAWLDHIDAAEDLRVIMREFNTPTSETQTALSAALTKILQAPAWSAWCAQARLQSSVQCAQASLAENLIAFCRKSQ